MNQPVDLSSERATAVCFPTSEVTPPIHCPELVISKEIMTKQYTCNCLIKDVHKHSHIFINILSHSFQLRQMYKMQVRYLAQEHVLGVFLSFGDLLSKVLHLGVLRSVGVNLVLQLLVLVEQLLGISQTVGDVF